MHTVHRHSPTPTLPTCLAEFSNYAEQSAALGLVGAAFPALEQLGTLAIGKGERRIVVPWFVGCHREGH